MTTAARALSKAQRHLARARAEATLHRAICTACDALDGDPLRPGVAGGFAAACRDALDDMGRALHAYGEDAIRDAEEAAR